ncbi:hypothetical protein CHN50_17020 [Priestia aryabhattai]|nr:hypothetical protein CHN50_17020 [Priestia aryabhattai]
MQEVRGRTHIRSASSWKTIKTISSKVKQTTTVPRQQTYDLQTNVIHDVIRFQEVVNKMNAQRMTIYYDTKSNSDFE